MIGDAYIPKNEFGMARQLHIFSQTVTSNPYKRIVTNLMKNIE